MAANNAPLLLDATRLVWRRWEGLRPTGIDRICLAWLAHYAPHAQAVIVQRRAKAILPVAASRKLFALLAEDEGTAADRTGFRWRMARLAARHGTDLARSLPGRGRIWLNPGHTGLNTPGLDGWCRATDIKPVYLVHDLIPITHPQFCRAGEAERHHLRMRAMLSTGHGLVANSGHTLETVVDFAGNHGLPMPPAIVAWPGTPELRAVRLAASKAPPTFVVLGTIESRKNHMLLLDVWEQLWKAHGPAAPQLTIIGRRGWACDDVLARLDAGGFGTSVLEAGAVEDADIARLLSGARALLFPSHAEGYGLPLVEALGAGVPVIASDLPVFREIGQAVPDLLPPDDVAGWTSAIVDYAAADSERRAAQMARMQGFSAPDWPSHFARVDAFITQLAAAGGSQVLA
ncbi:capsular polysaccharide glycosyltransferase biosynthesis protein [Polymorphobacter multimanifer]|uniref:Glycosyltransferase involved in cell wall biosynthesis n=1 Tax=Polymorphobacter multimanifer TaxID=1070431 RepID=A0A841LF78_9SPHN|nr:glycosyltransferase family 1 protein [Polymorphobacter multimanifer]MBB6227812.1 glycosyltransferase involved in cell wall biosynthesis [Polymorphobacter multimanifer]GGI78747.1 capsular polysaccharide glycosyltransferase biosynthesis protein [Polymorphobacter multimanifer]